MSGHHKIHNIHENLKGTQHKASNHVLDMSAHGSGAPISIHHNAPLTALPHQPMHNHFVQDFVDSEKKELLKLYKKGRKEVGGILTQFRRQHPAVFYFFEGLKFVGVTMMIFVVLFVAANFNAYGKQVEYWYQENVRPTEANEIVEQLEETLVKNSEIVIQKGEISKINMEVIPTDFRIVVPRIQVNAPIVNSADSDEYYKNQDWGNLEQSIQDSLRQGIVHYPYTADPGEPGNVFLTGHSSYYSYDPGRYKSIFALLDKLFIGDQVVVYKNGEKFIYTVYDSFTVTPDEVDVLDQDYTRFDMTLMSCWPVGTTQKRWIVKLHQIYPEPDISKIPEDIQKEVFGGGKLGAFR